MIELKADVKLIGDKKHILILGYPEHFTPVQVDNLKRMLSRWQETFNDFAQLEVTGAIVLIREDLSLRIESVERIA